MDHLIIIIMVVIVLLPFNDKFWTYINKDKKREITNFIDYSDYELGAAVYIGSQVYSSGETYPTR